VKNRKIELKPKVIKSLIETSGFEKEEIAQKTKISLKSLEEGKITIPQIKKLARVLKRPLVAFFSDEIPPLMEIHLFQSRAILSEEEPSRK